MKRMFSAGLGLAACFACVSASFAAGEAASPAPVVATDYAAPVKVTRLLKKTTDEAGRALAYPKPEDGRAEVTAVLVEIAPGGETGWHKHPITCVGYVMEGEIEVTLADGRLNKIKAGEALCEVVDLAHNGVNRGAAPAKLVLFVLGTKDGGPFTVKVPAPDAGAKKPGE